MTISFSLFKDIDFTKTENIIFLFIILIIALIIFFIIVITISKIIKGINRAIIGDNVKRPKFDRKRSDDMFLSPGVEEVVEKIDVPKPIVGRENLVSNFSRGNKIEDGEKDTVKAEKEKVGKKVEEGLAGLKHNIPNEGLQSKMPQREGENPESVDRREIELPKSSKEVPNSDNANSADSSVLFQGRSDVNRRKLEHEMKYNPKIWKAAKDSMLYLTPIERSKLVRETFSSAYGRNISKRDLHQAVKKLDRKMRASKTPKEHEKLRKEIKFFKKIGGI